MTTETNAERLERIKKEQWYVQLIDVGNSAIDLDDFNWLFQQAERAMELEKSIKGFAVAVEIYSEMPIDEAMKQLIDIVQEDSK